VLDDLLEWLKHEWNNANALSREWREERQSFIYRVKGEIEELRQQTKEHP
jgi:hypothetical protein